MRLTKPLDRRRRRHPFLRPQSFGGFREIPDSLSYGRPDGSRRGGYPEAALPIVPDPDHNKALPCLLRHTCATLLLSKNVNPKIVQEMLGHATISQTMDAYSHVMPGMGDVAATALEETLS